jgi:hypothetical protein
MALKHQDRIKAWLDEEGYTPEKIKLHTAGWFTKKEPKFQKMSGAVDKSTLSENAHVVAETGKIFTDKDGERYGNGETLIEIQVDSPKQLDALALASKHQGMLTEKIEFPKGVPVVTQMTDEDRNLLKETLEATKALILERHRTKIASSSNPA